MKEQSLVDQRINAIVDIMCRGEWVRGKTRRELAAQWGVPISTVANYAQLASKIVKSGTDEEVRERIIVESIEQLQDVSELAKADGEFNSAIKAIRVINEITGAVNNGPSLQLTIALGSEKLRMAAPDVAEKLSKAMEFFRMKEETHPGIMREFAQFIGMDVPPALAGGKEE